MTAIVDEIDVLVTGALTGLAADSHVTHWRAKETNWVNYFALQHLVPHCRPQGVLREPAQIGIEVSVPQPEGYKKVRRDLVIWPRGGMTCWNDQWEPAVIRSPSSNGKSIAYTAAIPMSCESARG